MKRLILLIIISFIGIGLSSCDKAYTPEEKGLYAAIQTSQGDIVVKLFEDKTPVTVSNFTGLAQGTKEWIDPKTREKVKKPFYNGLIFHRVIKDFMIQGGCPMGNGMGGPGYSFIDECFSGGEEVKGKIKDENTAKLVWAQIILPYLQKYRGKVPNKTIDKISKEVMSKRSVKPLIGKTIEFFQKEIGTDQSIMQNQKLIEPVAYGTIAMANSGRDSNGSQFFIVTRKEGTPRLNGKHTVFGKVVHGMETAHKIENVKTGQKDKPVEDVVIESITIIRIK